MEILEWHELVADKHYWLYPKSLVVLPQDQHRVCKTYTYPVDKMLMVQLEENQYGDDVSLFDDCMFIEIPRVDISVWVQHAEAKQFPELLQAREDAKDDE